VKSSKQANELVLGTLTININKRVVFVDNKEIFLPKKEFKILILLASKPENVFTREDIYKNIWGSDVVVGERTLDVHIRKLRKNIGEEIIRTHKGVGYSINKEA
jgi:two-component system alkaline phosphatase synthesis response regulator PhoP